MSDGTAIEWTDASWNPIRARRTMPDGTVLVGWHCTHASEGCRHCYAEGMNKRLGTKLPYKPGLLRTAARPAGEVEIFLDDKALNLPLRWRQPRQIFPGSMTDLFADFVTDDMLDSIFAVMAMCSHHVFQPLTKRTERMRRYVSHPDAPVRILNTMDRLAHRGSRGFSTWPLPNVWLGTSIENRAALLERAGHLRQTPAAVRWFSMEPLIGDPGEILLEGIDWVVVGGESGPGARPMHPDWPRSIRDQCAGAGAAFFFKQWGEFVTVFDRDREDPDWRNCDRWQRTHPRGRWHNLAGGTGFHGDRVVYVDRIGKRLAGRLLDGVAHDAKPGLAHG
jgi:protein gp37